MKIKHMNRSLLKDYTELINKATADRPRNRDLTVAQVESIYYGNPNYDEKGHFLAYVEDRLVGECSSIIDPGLGSYIDLSILPEYRRRGIGKQLVNKATEYLRHHHVTEVQTDVPATCKGSRKFYEKIGFTITGKTLELAINLQKDLPNILPPQGYVIHTPRFPHQKAEFLQVWNKANSETPESPPLMTPEAFDTFLTFPQIQSAYYAAVREKDNKIVGVLTCFKDPAHNKKNKVKEATIEIVGVLPEERRKGIAAALITEALKWMKTHDITTALAIVNSNNKNILAVANRLGTKITNQQLTYKLHI
jgi:ribosomal protein S18 acetylase RimI-like enzyme